MRSLRIIVASLLLCGVSWATVTLRQSPYAFGGTTSLSGNFTGGSNTLAGSLIVAGVASIQLSSSAADGPPVISTPVTTGFTWLLAGTVSAPQATEGSNHYTETVSFFYIPNAAVMATSLSTTIAIAPTGGGTVSSAFQLIEVTGIAITSPIDVSASASHPPDAQFTTAGDLVTTAAGIILEIVTNPNYNTEYEAGTGYTKIIAGVGPSASAWGVIQYQITSAGGTYATDWGPAVGQNGPWATLAVDFTIPLPAARHGGVVF